MVDGIDTYSPLFAQAGVVRANEQPTGNEPALKGSDGAERPGSEQTSGINETDVSAAIRKAAEEKLNSLSAGSVEKFLNAAEEFINKSLPSKPPQTRLRINQDDATGVFVYQGVDVNSGEVVKQWPADEILKFLAFYHEKEGAEGIVLDVDV
tara:strand:+ start:7457 stop:7912 length:456 start_codon:yes stop_codon:yes gene_type:complete